MGTERHESRRIDNQVPKMFVSFSCGIIILEFVFVAVVIQLRGRSGRQGDPGSSRFFLSLEDNIFRIFGGDRIQVTVYIYILFILLEDNHLNVVAIELFRV